MTDHESTSTPRTDAFIPRPIREGGDPYGTHRVREPRGALPQPAQVLDNDFSALFEGELLLAVDTLNVDAVSFRQMEEDAIVALTHEHSVREPSDREIEAGVAARVLATVTARGKQHNPVTGSGGMLLGRVRQIAPGRPKEALAVGDRVATLVSLSLTPLAISRVLAVRRASAQLDVEGEAVLFATGPYAKLPGDMPERLALAVLDVAGAAPQVARLVRPGLSVLVLGAGGKSGILSCVEARRSGGPSARIVGVEAYAKAAEELASLAVCDAVIEADARDPVALRRAALAANGGEEFDLTVSCVNVGDAEMAAILATKPRGLVYFFAMSTSFTKAALGAEGVGKDVDLMIGNGYAREHAEHSIALLRDHAPLRALFTRRYG